MVTERSTEEELATRLPEALDRVSRGERFQIESDGATFARIVPYVVKPGTTWAEFIANVGDLQTLGEGFADDLEAVQASQGIAEIPEWPD
jgi:antitoxin (DNA-binding transcriptional repressor) of toxin-antitoxin stability system